MSRKVLMSFLGTGNYLQCNYQYNDIKISNVKFIQEAIVNIFCNNWKSPDAAYIFVTEKAEKTHWNILEQILEKFDFVTNKVIIPDCSSEEELWQLFDKLIENIQVNDQIIFDITHSFRFMPLFAMSAINYLESIKKVNLLGIYYGAFEALGNPKEVEKMKIEERNAPIFNLSSTHFIQKWAKATEIFEETGRSQQIRNLSKNTISPILRETKGKDKEAQEIRNIVEEIYKLTYSIRSSRSSDIINYDFQDLKNRISKIKEQNTVRPLKAILEKIEKTFDNFGDETEIIKNSFAIVDWCIQYDLVQQGYTYLIETIYTYFVLVEDENIFDIEKREEISKKLFNEDLSIPSEKNKFYGALKDLQKYRNDINHCGYRKKPSKYENLRKQLEKYNKYFKEILLEK